MTRLTFLEAALAALALSIAGAALGVLLTPLFGASLVSRALCALLAFAWVLLLLARSRVRHGRMSLLALWLTAALAIAMLCPSLPSTAAAHLTVVWLARSLLMHGSAFVALADLALSALSLAAGCWAYVETASLWLSLWSVGLVQAACMLLPPRGTRRATSAADERFTQAACAAEQALRAFTRAR